MVSKPHIQLKALHGLARALAGGEFRARAVLDRACAAVAEGFGFERVGIVRYVPQTSTLIPFAAYGLTTVGTLIAAFLERAIAHSELRRLNELKSQFAALASHELRTPVAAIYGVIRTLDEHEEVLSEEQRSQLREVLSGQSQRLYELVENLLDLSRLEAESLRIVPAQLDVEQRLKELIGAACERPDEVELEVEPGLRAFVDQQALDRIVSNLLANAVRHGAP